MKEVQERLAAYGNSSYEGLEIDYVQGPVSRKSGPEKPFDKVRPAYSIKLVFSYVVKGIKTKITAKFRASRHLRFEDKKRIMSPEIRPKSFGTFEKQAPGFALSLVFWLTCRLFPWGKCRCHIVRSLHNKNGAFFYVSSCLLLVLPYFEVMSPVGETP